MESSYTHYIPHRLEIRNVIIADGRIFVNIFLIMMAMLFVTMIGYVVLGCHNQGGQQQQRGQEQRVRTAVVRVIENPIANVELV